MYARKTSKKHWFFQFLLATDSVRDGAGSGTGSIMSLLPVLSRIGSMPVPCFMAKATAL